MWWFVSTCLSHFAAARSSLHSNPFLDTCLNARFAGPSNMHVSSRFASVQAFSRAAAYDAEKVYRSSWLSWFMSGREKETKQSASLWSISRSENGYAGSLKHLTWYTCTSRKAVVGCSSDERGRLGCRSFLRNVENAVNRWKQLTSSSDNHASRNLPRVGEGEWVVILYSHTRTNRRPI